MNFPLLAVVLPFLGALGLSAFGNSRLGAIGNAAISAAGFALTLMVWKSGQTMPLAALFGVLSGFVGLTAGLATIWLRDAKGSGLSTRYAPALFQVLLGLSLLGLYSDNTGLLWLALAGETVAMAFGISLQGTKAAREAAWAYMLANGVAMGLALFGTLLVSLAVMPDAGANPAIMLTFKALAAKTLHFNQIWLSLGFIFVLFGYGAKAILVPLHGWGGANNSAGMASVYTLQGLSTTVALLAILRFRHIVQVNAGPFLPMVLLLAFAIISLFLAALTMARQNSPRRFCGGMASGQAAISLFAFGIGGPLAVFAGLLQMLLYRLLESGLFLALGRAMEGRGADDSFVNLRGLSQTNKYVGWVLGLMLFAASGLPPSGLFVSEFIVIHETALRLPWLCLPLLVGLMLCALPILRRVVGFLFTSPPPAKLQKPGFVTNLAMLHLALFFGLAFAMPTALVHMLTGVAEALQ